MDCWGNCKLRIVRILLLFLIFWKRQVHDLNRARCSAWCSDPCPGDVHTVLVVMACFSLPIFVVSPASCLHPARNRFAVRWRTVYLASPLAEREARVASSHYDMQLPMAMAPCAVSTLASFFFFHPSHFVSGGRQKTRTNDEEEQEEEEEEEKKFPAHTDLN